MAGGDEPISRDRIAADKAFMQAQAQKKKEEDELEAEKQKGISSTSGEVDRRQRGRASTVLTGGQSLGDVNLFRRSLLGL